MYENVDEAIGKYLQMTIKIRSAKIKEQKMRYKSVCSYEWPYGEGDGEGEDEIYDTVEFKDEESIADPLYNYK